LDMFYMQCKDYHHNKFELSLVKVAKKLKNTFNQFHRKPERFLKKSTAEQVMKQS